ncbi:MAG: hypothetical protein ACRD0X_02695, partial [Thermoanaerobaculia bacterium]
MRGRLAFSAAVLAGALYWADCGFDPGPPTPWNTYFTGCFEGPITEPVGAGRLRLVFEAPSATDYRALSGCVEMTIGPTTLATVTGLVQEDPRAEAGLLVTPTSGRPFFGLKVVREPSTAVAATNLDVSEQEGDGAPFVAANDLLRCAAPVTCADLG